MKRPTATVSVQVDIEPITAQLEALRDAFYKSVMALDQAIEVVRNAARPTPPGDGQ